MSLLVRKLISPYNGPGFNAAGFTHFIRFPLLNQSSSSQIQETLWHVANDPVSASIPSVAYRPLQRLNLSIAALRLPTESKRKQAIELLHDLGKREWGKPFSKLQTAPSNTSTSSTVNPERLSNERVDLFNVPPLVVSALFKATFPSTYHLRVPCLCREQDTRHAEWGR